MVKHHLFVNKVTDLRLNQQEKILKKLEAKASSILEDLVSKSRAELDNYIVMKGEYVQ